MNMKQVKKALKDGKVLRCITPSGDLETRYNKETDEIKMTINRSFSKFEDIFDDETTFGDEADYRLDNDTLLVHAEVINDGQYTDLKIYNDKNNKKVSKLSEKISNLIREFAIAVHNSKQEL